MKKLVIAVMVFCMVFSLQAQTDEKAQALLEEVSSKVQSYDNIIIDFKYALENTAENIKQETRGDVSLEGEKYLLNIMGTTRLFDGEKLYTIIPEDQEINISTYDPKQDDNITPSKMFTFYQDGYTSEWAETEDLKGRKIQYIKLTPIDANAEIQHILLGIDKQTKHIYNLIQTQDNGTKITITVNSFKTNQPIPKTLFEFREDRYEDFYINRLD